MRGETVAIQWPQPWLEWLTPETALENWPERIERAAAEEAAHLAGLPYVKGVAIIGTVGRGTPWPLSDIDLLVVADYWRGQRPHGLIEAVEQERNRRLHAARIPNEVEARLWTILPHYITQAVSGDEGSFVSIFDHWPMLGIPMKAQGGTVVADCDAQLGRFIKRCNRLVFSDRFVHTWLRTVTGEESEKLKSAADLIGEADWTRASLEILRATQGMTAGIYGMWRRVPESLMRCVSRLLATARDMGDEAMGESFLTAACLSEEDTWGRFASVPSSGRCERDRHLAIRQGAAEDVDELGATRDLLHSVSYLDVWRDERATGPYPEWSGVTGDKARVRAQFDAAEEILRRLQLAKRQLGKGHS
jgi:predicted nucleotidyltransferase